MGNVPTDRPAWLDEPPPAPPPEVEPAAPAAPIPPWQPAPRPASSRLFIYISGLLIIVGIVGGGIYVRDQIIANQAADNLQYDTSTPKSLLSPQERADRFASVQVTPAVAALLTPLQNVSKDCSPKTMVPACKPDLIATNQALIAGDAAMQQADVPVCIGPQVSQLKYDWQGLEQGVGLAISGYNASSYDLYLQGMVKFLAIAQFIKPDMDRITTAEKGCSATPG
jgi:hypothetical protein